ncbi:MAG: hypothetical protein HYZ92_02580 [Candidatus Omnitrophica bacterium]|nr:hypothetical protein [Candidatus Omnitrophota bacterium]
MTPLEKRTLTIVTGLLVAGCLAYRIGSGLALFWIACGLSIVVAGPLAFGALALSLAARRRPSRWLQGLSEVCYACSLIILMLFLSIPLTAPISTYEIFLARRYCARIIQQLEAQHQSTGVYPETIDRLIPVGQKKPRFLSGPAPIYRKEGETFLLWFWDPGEFMGQSIVYSSKQRKWSR